LGRQAFGNRELSKDDGKLQHLLGSRRSLVKMRPLPILSCACLALVLGTTSALAFRPPDTNTALPTEHQMELRYADVQNQPYAMNYTDEAAQQLGVHDGQWEAFNTHSSDPLMPSFRGGVDNGSAMVKLQWVP
jgi:hypothetical protein